MGLKTNGKRGEGRGGRRMMKEEKHKELWRVVKFTLFSASAGLIEIGSFTLLNELTRWSYWPCYLIALVLSVLWNFTLNRKFTFRSVANIPVAMAKVALYYAVFTPLSTVAGNYLAEARGWNEYLVTALNMIVNFVTEFLFQRYVVYGKSVDSAQKKD
jgi:putative flippase GtrA